MSTDSSGGNPKKLTTAEILAKARAEKAAAAAAKPAAEPAPAAEAPNVEAAAPAADPAAPVAPAAPAAKPKSTAEILAAARAAKAGGAAPAAAPAATAPAAPTAVAAGKPKSTAEILAAARANKAAAAGEAAPAAAPAAAAKPAVAAKPVAATGPKPSVQEMLAAVRGGGGSASGAVAPATAAAATAPKAVVAPPMPVKPPPPAAKKAADAATRRDFISATLAAVLSPFWVAWASFTAASLAFILACLRFMLPNVLTEPPSKFKIGPASDYDLGTVSEKFKAQFGIWIVHTDKYQGKNLIYALSTVCTHLGCTPSWLEGEQKFKCPCHGSGFYINGINFEGPAPRPLERVGLKEVFGVLEVDKSRKFQEEMGQWADPESYVEVG